MVKMLGIVLVLLAVNAAMAEQPDRHLDSTNHTHVLYQRSAYAHGYMHGYEDGFHNADIDIHMGRGARALDKIDDYRKGDGGYRSEFGDRHYFEAGYKEGFKEGYSDSIQGLQFRAVSEVRKIAAGMGKDQDSTLSGKDFDRAFATGYDVGRKNGIDAGTDEDGYATCRSNLSRLQVSDQTDYCDAFARGFSLGFSDGLVTRESRHTETAKSFQQR